MMGPHVYHPRTHDVSADGDEPVFFDDCPECERKATDALLWDEEVFGEMWRKMLEVEYGGNYAGHYRSTAEATAGRQLYRLAIVLERHFAIPPRTVTLGGAD